MERDGIVHHDAPPSRLQLSLGSRLEPALVGLAGLLLASVVAASDGGYFPAPGPGSRSSLWLLAARDPACRDPAAAARLGLRGRHGGVRRLGRALDALARSAPSTRRDDPGPRYAAVVLALLLVVRRRTVRRCSSASLRRHGGLDLHALTRLHPDWVGGDPSTLGYRLSGPIGYWNGLGVYAAMGVLLALGFAARGRADRRRARARRPCCSLPTMQFTFSRGAWLALLVGLAAAILLDARRLQLAFASAVLGVLPAVGVLLASRSRRADAAGSVVRRRGAGRPPASRRRSFCSRRSLQRSPLCSRSPSSGVRVPSALRSRGRPRWSSCSSSASRRRVAAAGLAGARRPACVGQGADGPQATGNNGRLFDLSSNGRLELWRVAWDDLLRAPGCGVGGGTYWQAWAASPRGVVHLDRGARRLRGDAGRARGRRARAAARSSLVPPFVGAVRARRSPLVPFAFAAFAGWVVHAGVDWDWELMGVSGAALLCGVALVAAGRGGPRALRSGGARRRARRRGAADAGRDDAVCSRASGSTRPRLRFGKATSAMPRRTLAAHDGSLPGRRGRSR